MRHFWNSSNESATFLSFLALSVLHTTSTCIWSVWVYDWYIEIDKYIILNLDHLLVGFRDLFLCDVYWSQDLHLENLLHVLVIIDLKFLHLLWYGCICLFSLFIASEAFLWGLLLNFLLDLDVLIIISLFLFLFWVPECKLHELYSYFAVFECNYTR
jgi:hypothetical protein